ncbi:MULTISPECIES: lactococcin 972 family bacteriocin [Streptomycetaceae]|uniref:lactococcin 972 family bacteriocin n=1 Tax=Streptomycetaceae TaxID=2062 RepID=UPI000AA1B42E|nr:MULTISPECIES: lactococcin 972 family bacteriocin [Streptomycetaceae]MYS60623.1 hypothetical protein [Streptomyces sp. SID5468]
MKTLGRSIALIGAAAALSAGAFISPATAAAPQQQAPAFLGHPKAWGEVTFTINPSSKTMSPQRATESVGGGTWEYGSGIDGGSKSCWSNYVHPSLRHSATATIANAVDKEYADAGSWADAYVTAGLSYTCKAYWATY